VGELLPYKIFFDTSGGGVTISGGEVLFQPDFAIGLLRRLKEEGVHTVVETSCMGNPDKLRELSLYTDIFYCDLKIMDDGLHVEHTGASNKMNGGTVKTLSFVYLLYPNIRIHWKILMKYINSQVT
jgi:pyruvate formate lyase activating enzyme